METRCYIWMGGNLRLIPIILIHQMCLNELCRQIEDETASVLDSTTRRHCNWWHSSHLVYILLLTHGDGFGVKRIRLTLSLNRCSLFLHVFQRAVCDNYDTKRQHLFFAAPPSRRWQTDTSKQFCRSWSLFEHLLAHWDWPSVHQFNLQLLWNTNKWVLIRNSDCIFRL